MCLVQLRDIGGISPFIVGYLYANLLGSFLVFFVMKEMRKLIGGEPEKKYHWQPHVTGIIERTMYIISFVVGRPEFVVAWLVFKAAGGWEVWKTGLAKDGDGGDPHQGRAMYSNMFNGSALSILYAGMGYLIIIWWKDRETLILLGGALFVLTLLLLLVLDIIRRCREKSCEEIALRVKHFPGELHRQAKAQAANEGVSLKDLIIKVVREYLKTKGGK